MEYLCDIYSLHNKVKQLRFLYILQVYFINGDPVAFEYMSKWFLTVYSVWKAPSACPSLLTWEAVLRKLANGADLMVPGLVVREETKESYMSLLVSLIYNLIWLLLFVYIEELYCIDVLNYLWFGRKETSYRSVMFPALRQLL